MTSKGMFGSFHDDVLVPTLSGWFDVLDIEIPFSRDFYLNFWRTVIILSVFLVGIRMI